MERNRSIHGLRGLAVLMVFAYHLYRSVLDAGFGLALDEQHIACKMLDAGRLGVDLFFMISGYLITGSLLRHRSASQFLISRAIRVYPAFLVLHVLIFAVGPAIGYSWMAGLGPGQYAVHFVSNLLFLPGVFDLPIAQIVAWSLSYECAFYLLAASAGWTARRPSGAGRLALWTCWAVPAALMLWHHPRAWFFVTGAAVHVAAERNFGRGSQWLPLLGPPALIAMAACFEAAFPLALLCGLAGFAAVVVDSGPVAWVLRRRVLQGLGEISYSFYLWHTPVFFMTKRLFGGQLIHEPAANIGAFVLASSLVSLVAAYLSWRLVEHALTERLREARTFQYDLDAMLAWHLRRIRSRAAIGLEGAVQPDRMAVCGNAPSSQSIGPVQRASLIDQEDPVHERHRRRGAAGDEARRKGERQDAPEEAAAVRGDRA